jgi:hypothetical protein
VLIQCITGCLGLYYLARANIRYWFGETLSERGSSRAALAVLLFLVLLPLSPVMFYLAHLGKDTWGAISVLWIGVCSFNLFRSPGERGGWYVALNTFLLQFTITLFLLVRFNAILLLPVFVLLVFVLLKPWGLKKAALLAAVTGALPFVADWSLRQLVPINRSHAEDQIMSCELVGMCVLDESLCAELPFTDSHLIKERYRQEYQWGYADPLFPWWGGAGPIVKPGYCADHHDELAPEYRRAARQHPDLLVKVKWKAFTASLMDDYPNRHHRVIDPNDLGIALNARFQKPRAFLLSVDEWINTDKFLRRVARRHIFWLALTMASIAFLGVRGALRRDRRLLFASLLLLMPLGYYSTFLLATASHNFRYMYPATLFVQILTVALAAGWLFRARELQQRVISLERSGPPDANMTPADEERILEMPARYSQSA